MIQVVLLTVLLCPGQVIVAADDSPERWQDRADFHCRDEVDDAVVLNRAAQAAGEDNEILWLATGQYRQRTAFVVPRTVKGVVGMGKVLLRGNYDGWLMQVKDMYQGRIEGLSFAGKGVARGLSINGCQDTKFSRLKFTSCAQALKVTRGHCTYLSAIRADWCRRPSDPLTEPIIELNGFGSSSLRGAVILHCETEAPVLAINGAKGTFSEINIESCKSDDSMIRVRGTHVTLGPFHFEKNTSPVQIRGVDCRQVNIHGLSCGNDRANPVEVGVLLTRCRDTLVDSVIVTYCRDALVRIGPKCRGCPPPTRIDLYYTDRSVYDGVNGRVLPKHIVDYQGSN